MFFGPQRKSGPSFLSFIETEQKILWSGNQKLKTRRRTEKDYYTVIHIHTLKDRVGAQTPCYPYAKGFRRISRSLCNLEAWHMNRNGLYLLTLRVNIQKVTCVKGAVKCQKL